MVQVTETGPATTVRGTVSRRAVTALRQHSGLLRMAGNRTLTPRRHRLGRWVGGRGYISALSGVGGCGICSSKIEESCVWPDTAIRESGREKSSFCCLLGVVLCHRRAYCTTPGSVFGPGRVPSLKSQMVWYCDEWASGHDLHFFVIISLVQALAEGSELSATACLYFPVSFVLLGRVGICHIRFRLY